MKKKILKILLIISILPILFLLFLLISTLTEYKPNDEAVLYSSKRPDILPDSAVFSVLSWNIGYAGLGKDMDFFYDGGKRVRDTRINTRNNLNAISAFLAGNDSVSFILLQEADIASKRSYKVNQVALFDSLLDGNGSFTGINYKAGFVPVPFYSPMGKVKSGIVTYSDFVPSNVRRYSYEAYYAWPTRLFMLKRCFVASRFTLENGKEFILVNTHNSAFDDGSHRAGEMRTLAAFAEKEYHEGNFILMGGDWNQSPSHFAPKYSEPFDTIDIAFIPDDFLPGWQQVFPEDGPTNRRVLTAYDKSTTLTTTIDFFIASPNITIDTIRRIDLGFAHSDHQPVILTFSLR
jgi:endonuclease/exonuclease/phosphatase family metal-dependent hydrolase